MPLSRKKCPNCDIGHSPGDCNRPMIRSMNRWIGSHSTRVRWLRRVALVAGCLGAFGCGDGGGTGPNDKRATLSIQPTFAPDINFQAFANLVVDRVRFRLVRLPLETLVDTVLDFPADSNRIALRVAVPLRATTEELDATLDLFDGDLLLFTGKQRIEVAEGINVFPVAAIPVNFVGPGQDITDLLILPRDTVLSLGSGFGFSVIASKGGILVDPPVYLSWESSNPVLAPVSLIGEVQAPTQRGSVLLRVTTPSGARDSTVVTFAPPPTAITVLSSGGQSAQVGTALPEQFTVQVLASANLGVQGVRVNFFAPSGGRVDQGVVITGPGGIARTGGRLGTMVGNQVFTAEVVGLPVAQLTINALPGLPFALDRFSGDQQTGTVGQALPSPLSARVLDQFGNPIPNVRVEWQVLSGGGTLSETVTFTDPLGFTQVAWTLGPIGGMQAVLASLPGTSLLTAFSATATTP